MSLVAGRVGAKLLDCRSELMPEARFHGSFNQIDVLSLPSSSSVFVSRYLILPNKVQIIQFESCGCLEQPDEAPAKLESHRFGEEGSIHPLNLQKTDSASVPTALGYPRITGLGAPVPRLQPSPARPGLTAARHSALGHGQPALSRLSPIHPI